jgi:hypothetical protein
VPTVLERDFNFPPLEELLAEVDQIKRLQLPRQRHERNESNKPPEKLLASSNASPPTCAIPTGAAAPEGVEDRRLAIYRRLFFNNLSNLFRRNFPVIRKLYESAAGTR